MSIEQAYVSRTSTKIALYHQLRRDSVLHFILFRYFSFVTTYIPKKNNHLYRGCTVLQSRTPHFFLLVEQPNAFQNVAKLNRRVTLEWQNYWAIFRGRYKSSEKSKSASEIQSWYIAILITGRLVDLFCCLLFMPRTERSLRPSLSTANPNIWESINFNVVPLLGWLTLTGRAHECRILILYGCVCFIASH